MFFPCHRAGAKRFAPGGRAIVLACWALLAGIAAGSAADVPPNPLAKPGWVLDAHDEFEGPTLNTNLKEWQEHACLLSIDNRPVMSMPQAPQYPSLFLLTLYGNTREPARKEFVIDYFRAYKKAGQPLTPGAEAFR